MANDLTKKGPGTAHQAVRRKSGQWPATNILKQFDEGFATFLNEQLFGTIWTRPGLETKMRSLITMTALMALGRGPELRLHMRGALNIGVTQQEIKEMIIHISQYSGVPTAVEAIRAFREGEPRPKRPDRSSLICRSRNDYRKLHQSRPDAVMTMKIGMLTVVNEYSVDPATLARKAEALGFESLWLPDHPVMPVHTTTPLPETPPGKGEIPDHYSHMCDPFVAMAMAAAATTRLKVATGVCLVPERNPILTANEVATLDHFSGGRVCSASAAAGSRRNRN